MNASTDWGSALAILAAGLILGLIVFLAAKRRKSSAALKRRELEARRDALVQQLRDLGPDVADDERTWLETETAGSAGACSTRFPPPRRPRKHRRRTAVPPSPASSGAWPARSSPAASSITAPPSSASANPGAAGAAECDDRSEAARRSRAHRSDNPDHRIALAKMYFGQNDLMAAFEQTKAVLAKNPNEPRALTYNAVVRMSMGEMDQARKQLETGHQERSETPRRLGGPLLHPHPERR
jgi:hypothetical protein